MMMPDGKLPDSKRIQDARHKKDKYREGTAGDSGTGIEAGDAKEDLRKRRDLSEWTDIVGQRIEQAMREGSFDDLPGKGRPLDLKKNPFVPEDRQMAFKLLENNDLAPAWISERTSVLDAIEAFREDVRSGAHSYRAWLKRTTDPSTVEQASDLWQSRLVAWSDAIVALNRRIEMVNLQQPIAHLEIIKLRLSDELTRAGAGEDLMPPA